MRFSATLALGVVLACSGAVCADAPPPFPEFTFKMAKPPKKGVKRFITVQIEPQPERPKAAEPSADGAAADARPRPDASYGWYWTAVPPELGADSGARLSAAFANLAKGPGGSRVVGPRLQVVEAIARTQGPDILRATIGTQVSPALVIAVIAVESGGRADAVSGAGAQGLMQLTPGTAERFGVTDSLSPGQNIKGGVAYLDWLMEEFSGDAVLALAGYNAGENAVKSHAGVPPFAETRDYVPKVLAAFEVARALCQTRPELITDACALRLASN